MKTKEQAAQEYAENCTLNKGAERTKREIAFIAGVNFALQWINVADELPKEYYKRVIVKNQEGEWLVAFWNGKEWYLPYTSFLQEFPFEVTHWRHLEFN